MKKKTVSKALKRVTGLALAAMIAAPVSGATVSEAATYKEYTFSSTREHPVAYTALMQKKTKLTTPARIVPSFFYNTTGGNLYYRVVHPDKKYATTYKEITNSNVVKLDFISSNTKNEYMLRANLENANTRGYIATKGTWRP